MAKGGGTNKLTNLQVKKLKYREDGSNRYSDGGSLYLEVDKSGGKYWRMTYIRPLSDGKRNTLAFGVYPEVSLEEARKKRDETKKLLREQIDPSEHKKTVIADKKRDKNNTFEKFAKDWLELRTHEQKDDRENKRMLEKDVLPYIGHLAIKKITAELIEEEIIKKFIDRKALKAAKKVRVPLRGVFEYARKRKVIKVNPMSDVLIPKSPTGNFPAIVNPKELKELIVQMWQYADNPHANLVTAYALRLSVLFFVRPTELRMMKWSDYNREDGWIQIIPLKQNKYEKQMTLIIPLATQASEILNDLFKITGRSDYIFYSSRGKESYLSEGTVGAALKRLGFRGKQTAHGFRATARTILAERCNQRTDLIEKQLSHKTKDPNGGAYDRTEYLQQRRELMQVWADYIFEMLK